MAVVLAYMPLIKRAPQKIGIAYTSKDVLISVPAIAPDKPMAATWFQPAAWQGATVLVICGAGEDRLSFKWKMFKYLLGKNVAILTIDPPGHGDYMTVPSTVDNARKAAQAAADWLFGQPHVRKVGAIGISFGGCQVAALAAADTRIAAMCSIASPVVLRPVTRPVIIREAIRLLLPLNIALLRHVSIRDVLAEWKSLRGAWYGESLYDMIQQFKIDECVRQIGARPTLIVHGAQDMAVPPHNAHQIHDAAHPERELLMVSQATHLTVVLRDRPMKRVAEWMAEKLA